jgi:tuftelin-interacting protein 11
VDNAFGAFERHTRGIGAKLLKQMGYQEGQGLGRSNQGIVHPVQARKWDRRAGLGQAAAP